MFCLFFFCFVFFADSATARCQEILDEDIYPDDIKHYITKYLKPDLRHSGKYVNSFRQTTIKAKREKSKIVIPKEIGKYRQLGVYGVAAFLAFCAFLLSIVCIGNFAYLFVYVHIRQHACNTMCIILFLDYL